MSAAGRNGSVVDEVDASHIEKGRMDEMDAGEKKMEEHDGDLWDPDLHGYKFKKDRSLWVKFKVPIFGEIRFNPVVSGLAILLIWTFVGTCAHFKEEVPFKVWRGWIVDNFTWLYIGSQDVWMIFAVALYFSKYSKIKMGKDTDVPEYSDPTWFMMLFACGIGVGLFFWGVAEPLYHYTSDSRYSADHTTPDNTMAQIAINVTLYHWGIHGWIVYSLVGLLLGILSYREGLPMTMKSCFYPLIGDKIFGWIGDLIDITSIITTLFGVCTSLGLGTKQLNTGLNMVNSDIPDNDITTQIIIIWVITAVATISTVSGVGMGIRRLSELCFLVGMFLMTVAFFMDDTFFILNLYCQSFGYYFQHLIQLGFHTDAFEQLGPSYGAYNRTRRVPDGFEFADGDPNWMDSWTMFYWGWWISWCPFVGMFIAKISKGRTIKEFINGTLTAPMLYTFMWLIIFGGAGIKQERGSAQANLCCPAKGEVWFWPYEKFSVDLANRISDLDAEVDVVATDHNFLCNGTCGWCAETTLKRMDEANRTYNQMLYEYETLTDDFGSVSLDRSLARLSCHSTEQMWFDVMRSYSGIGNFLAGFSLLGIVLYFITSSDSGSLVIDCLSANGDPDPPRIQRVFWALTEGATATALLYAGGEQGLLALQTAGILSGLPFTFVVCMLCVSVWRTCKVAAGDLDPFGPTFKIGLFDAFAPEPYSKIRMKHTAPIFLKFLANIFTAPWTTATVAARLNDHKGRKWLYALPMAVSLFLFFLFHFLQLAFDGAWAIAWFFYLCLTTIMTAYRIQVRERYNIIGNPCEDFFACWFYPCAAIQMEATTEDLEKESGENLKKNKGAPPENIGMKDKNGGVDNTAYDGGKE